MDFADVRSVMANAGSSLMGAGSLRRQALASSVLSLADVELFACCVWIECAVSFAVVLGADSGGQGGRAGSLSDERRLAAPAEAAALATERQRQHSAHFFPPPTPHPPGLGKASGRGRAREAAVAAISSPLLDMGIERATGIVWNITGGADLTLHEARHATRHGDFNHDWLRDCVGGVAAAAVGVLLCSAAAAAAPAVTEHHPPCLGSAAQPSSPHPTPPAPPPKPSASSNPTLTTPRLNSLNLLPLTTSPQVNEAAEIIYDLVDPNALIIFGAVVDDRSEWLAPGEVAITIIATGGFSCYFFSCCVKLFCAVFLWLLGVLAP